MLRNRANNKQSLFAIVLPNPLVKLTKPVNVHATEKVSGFYCTASDK